MLFNQQTHTQFSYTTLAVGDIQMGREGGIYDVCIIEREESVFV